MPDEPRDDRKVPETTEEQQHPVITGTLNIVLPPDQFNKLPTTENDQ